MFHAERKGMEMKGKKQRPRKPGEPLSDPVREKFAQQLAAGLSQSAALRIAKPAAKNWKIETVRSNSSKIAAEPEVEARKKEILAETIPATVLKKCELLELISDELREASREPGMLSAASALVDKFAKLMDWYPHPELTLKNGGVSDNYKAPPGVAGLSDDEIRALLAR